MRLLLNVLALIILCSCSSSTVTTESNSSFQGALTSQEFTELKNSYALLMNLYKNKSDDLLLQAKKGKITGIDFDRRIFALKQRSAELQSNVRLAAKKFHSKYPDVYDQLGYENFLQEITMN